ncbi:MAG: bifunctional metallophosphatase/5'-nucleotidase [Flavobacteriales bacterium]|jgi:5'-nucleotidase|nr:bifunctional metallophosphatase/5'-nucleotidase [Flavobacteriales bacterium]MBT5090255.1 bifunctional metallophosphatase/5'-nucleotidase [Flavobacteriales bacterium]MBT5750074.1 bifunctional metallophosphatase/5'-nucleotidase [Flavobacteriales bacterium]
MSNRRHFIKQSGLGTIGLSLLPQLSFGDNKDIKITILHTNDMHSHIHPFTSGRNKGLGGMAQRAALIKQIRKQEEHVLLLDAGDVFQGTPYFNVYGGELEFKLMSEMKYDAVTLGNHDFDNGLEGLKKQLPHANFPFLIANYDFSDTILKDTFKPYKVFRKGDLKIGVFGIGIELAGLVPKKLYQNTVYQDPISTANHYSNLLKQKEKCDLVICLSHLGFKYREEKISDMTFAGQTRNIDLIIGGHTHTFLKSPVKQLNLDQKEIIINQVGWAGVNIGKIDYHFSQNDSVKKVFGRSIFVKHSSKNA